jgi:Na+-driven multidrug efflux pump
VRRSGNAEIRRLPKTESPNDDINGSDNQMKDLTQGSIVKHLLHLSAFLTASLLGQILYLIVDLYWVGHLGKEAIAAVGIAGNLTMVVLVMSQVLRVGTTTVISQSAGEKDQARAEAIFNQSFVLSLLLALMVGACGFLLRAPYCGFLSADTVTATLAKSYLLWFIPALLLQFPMVSLDSALRSTGVVKPAVGLQLLGIAVNIVLAPLLIFGVGPWPRLGVTGAGLASFISILITDALMVAYFT